MKEGGREAGEDQEEEKVHDPPSAVPINVTDKGEPNFLNSDFGAAPQKTRDGLVLRGGGKGREGKVREGGQDINLDSVRRLDV